MADRPNPKRKIVFIGLRLGDDHKGSDRWAEMPEELEQWVGIDPAADRAAECPEFPALSELRVFSYTGSDGIFSAIVYNSLSGRRGAGRQLKKGECDD